MKLPEFCRRIVEASWFTGFIITVIVFAGILVGLETSASLVAEHGGLLGREGLLAAAQQLRGRGRRMRNIGAR